MRSDGTNLTYVSYSIDCTPADPISASTLGLDYPIDKLFSLRQVFTEYDEFVQGDYIDLSGKRYAIRIVNHYDELDKMSEYFQLIVEQHYES